MATGYRHPAYASSLSEFGEPLHLVKSDAWLLKRAIPGTDRSDATGCYPLFLSKDWTSLCSDLERLSEHLVTVTLVTDPFAPLASGDLRQCFNHVSEFKSHYTVDLSRRPSERISRHHRYYARWALRHGVVVESCDDPPAILDEWLRLYDNLIDRRSISGLKRFSAHAFRKQLSVPGISVFRARLGRQTVAVHIWYRCLHYAYSHLQATAPDGYRSRAAYALYGYGLESLAQGCEVATLGAGAGTLALSDPGLEAFKRGWSTGTLPVFLCGRVHDAAAYQQLCQQRPAGDSSYFPGYRADELT